MTLANDITAPLRHADRFFIGGEWVKPSSDAVIDVIDSAQRAALLQRRRGPRRPTWLALSPRRARPSTRDRGPA